MLDRAVRVAQERYRRIQATTGAPTLADLCDTDLLRLIGLYGSTSPQADAVHSEMLRRAS